MNTPLMRHLNTIVVCFCTTILTSSWSKKARSSGYHENLAKHRKEFKAESTDDKKDHESREAKKTLQIQPTHDVTDHLARLLGYRKTACQKRKTISGYTLQVYVGSSRERASKIRSRLYNKYLPAQPKLRHHHTNYIVELGKFLDPLEAYPIYAALKKYMPQTTIKLTKFPNKAQVFTQQYYAAPSSAPQDAKNIPEDAEERSLGTQ